MGMFGVTGTDSEHENNLLLIFKETAKTKKYFPVFFVLMPVLPMMFGYFEHSCMS